DPARHRGGHVAGEVDAGVRAQEPEDAAHRALFVERLVLFQGLMGALADPVRELARAADAIDHRVPDGAQRHAIELRVLRTLGEYAPPCALDFAEAARAVTAGTGEDYGGGFRPALQREGPKELVDGQRERLQAVFLAQPEVPIFDHQ